MRFNLIFLLQLVLCVAQANDLGNMDDASEKRPQIRMNYGVNQCVTFFCPNDAEAALAPLVNESVGIPIAQGRPSDFRNALLNLRKFKGPEYFNGAVVYLAGVDSRDAADIQHEHETILKDLGLNHQVKVKVISIHLEKLNGFTWQSFRALWGGLKDWFPNITKDYEKPNIDEVVAGIVAAAIVEVGTVYYLYNKLPTIDASLTLTGHFTLIVLYSIYNKTLINWLLRPDSSHWATFVKQFTASAPFIINYSFFGHFTPMIEFLQSHSIEETRRAFTREFGSFVANQSFTTLLQVTFYALFMNRVVRTWVNQQNGIERSNDARVWGNLAPTPVLMIDAMILAMATGASASTLFQIGPIEFNDGHAYLTLLTAVSYFGYKYILNPSFTAYLWAKHKASPRVIDFFHYHYGFDLRYMEGRAKQIIKSCRLLLTN